MISPINTPIKIVFNPNVCAMRFVHVITKFHFNTVSIIVRGVTTAIITHFVPT